MAQARIPFVPDQQSGWSQLGGGAPVAMNVVVDGRGVVRRRPGLTLFGALPDVPLGGGEESGPLVASPLDIAGIYTALNGDLYVVDSTVPGRRIFRYSLSDESFKDLSSSALVGSVETPIAERVLFGDGRPVFSETEAMLVIAGGHDPRKVVFAPPVASPLGGGPPKASHIVANGSRLIANEVADAESRSRFFYSDQAIGSSTTGHETWTGVNTGFITAEARPDKIVAIHENTNEVFVFGQETLQVYSPDAFFVYSALPVRNHGAAAPYGIIEVDQKFAWLDHRRRFVISDGRSLDYVGEPIQSTIDSIPSVADAFGYRVRTGFVDTLVWTFPSEGRSFAYQMGGGWSQWSSWDGQAPKQFIVTCHHLAPGSATNMVGLTAGRVATLSLDSQSDLGSPIHAYVRTGFIDRETDRRKHCMGIRIALRRGEVAGSTAPIAWIRYRDDTGGDWKRLALSLGASNDREINVPLRSLGVYRRRQWEFEFSSTVDLELAAVTEEYEVLGN